MNVMLLALQTADRMLSARKMVRSNKPLQRICLDGTNVITIVVSTVTIVARIKGMQAIESMHHRHHARTTDEMVATKEENKDSTVDINEGFPQQSETLATSEAFLMQRRTQEESKARLKKRRFTSKTQKRNSRGTDGTDAKVHHSSQEEETRTAYDPMTPTVGTRPGAFRAGGSDGSSVISDEDPSLHGDIEPGIVPPSFDEPTIEAHVVDEALEPVLVSATRLKSCKERIRSLFFNRQFVFLVGGCVALAVVISIMVKDTEPTPPVALPYLLPFLESISPDGGVALSDMNTPQFRAATWLAGNTNLATMSNRTKVQRYALATLYYSTGGDQWFTNYKWLTDSNECEWYNTKWDEGWESDPSLIRDYEFCSEEDGGDLEMIFLEGNNLRGQVPLELSLLSNSLGKNCFDCFKYVWILCSHPCIVLSILQYEWIFARDI